ncbi:MAG: hypothetical protein DMF98_11960 [Acidobacteria bacterium]|nr:MAG: hypothetical protein DMF98_11960 [Acidobacteriota bacterium]
MEEAADILGEHFGGDSETLSLLKALDPSLRNQGVILALCAGWPESAELAGVFEAFTKRDRHLALNYPTMFALKYTCTPTGDLTKALGGDLRRGTKFVLPNLVKPLRRRIVRDRSAQATFEDVIKDSASPTAKATTARLLAIATGLNEQLRAWSELEVRPDELPWTREPVSERHAVPRRSQMHSGDGMKSLRVCLFTTSESASGHAFQACSIDHSDISPL